MLSVNTVPVFFVFIHEDSVLDLSKMPTEEKTNKTKHKNRQSTHSTQQRRTHAALHKPTGTNNQIHHPTERPPEDTVDDTG